MGKDLRSYNGAVLFVDILGFGALTNGLIPLDKKDYEPWLARTGHEKNNQFLAAVILVKFRRILQDLEHEFIDVKVAQLSDCFFAWSEDIKSTVEFAHRYMHLAIENGILCRGGLAYGEIIETEQSHQMGRLILGNAVTKAVELEKLAKGARLLINEELPLSLYNQNRKFNNQVYEMFLPFVNPLDYETYDEFKWYLIKDLKSIPAHGISSMPYEQKLENTKLRLSLSNHIQYNPLYRWNAKNKQGLVHLQATSNFLSENYFINVFHRFSGKPIVDSRSDTNLKNLNRIVDNDTGYRFVEDPPEEDYGD